MSCYEWERGTITIPSKEWAGLKKEVREAWNDLQERAYEAALDVWKDVKSGTPYEKALRKVNGNNPPNCRARFGSHETEEITVQVEWTIRESIFRRKGGSKVYKPRKKDFPQKTNRDTEFRRGEWSIRFDNKNRSVEWHVSEGNRARDHARRDPVVRAFFEAMGSITWTRGSGGKIVGNDEYNRESTYEGGGGNYVCVRFGPRGKTSGVW